MISQERGDEMKSPAIFNLDIDVNAIGKDDHGSRFCEKWTGWVESEAAACIGLTGQGRTFPGAGRSRKGDVSGGQSGSGRTIGTA
jgi:hypothetical protein